MNRPLRTRSSRARTAMLLALALSIPAALPLGTASAGHFAATEELSATDNIGAAIAYSASTFDTAEEVALGRNDAFPDSLASGMLQATRPLLLTAADALSEATKEELARLGATTVHVLGGEQAIQPAVVTALEAEGYTVQRHSGPTRVDTAVAVAKNLGAAATSAIVARAFGTAEDETRAFADSLAAGGWAAAAAMPVLLTETEKLSDAVATYLEESSITEVFVVGGQAAVSEAVVTPLTAQGMTVKRVSGPTRFHTALAIAAERGFATAADAEKVILTEGQAEDAWAAGFAAAGRSAKDNAPIVLAVGAEVPEPTLQFLTGTGGEPTPDPEPTEDPTGEPTPDPTEEPTGEPTPDPEPDAGTGLAALLCAPMLASEACDIAAEALGQGPGEGPGLLHVEVPAVARFDHAEGRVTMERKAVNRMSVTGCGYTDEPVFVDTDGTFYLMLAGDPGTCSAEFALDTAEGVKKQTVEFSVGENFTPPSTLVLPELVAVRPVKQDEEGVHLRFVFDEPIAPSPAIDPTKFHLFTFKGTPGAPDDQSSPSFIGQDPRNPSAVIAVFSATQFADATVAAVTGGFVCAPATSAPAPCDSTTPGTAVKIPNGDWAKPGAVRDIDRLPNPTAHFPLRTVDKTEASSLAPDLLSVGGYEASDSSLLFTFSEAVTPPTAADKAGTGAATVLLEDGTIKGSDANGWRQGPTPESLRVTFKGDQLSSADMEQARRAIVKHGTVEATVRGTDLHHENTPVAAIIAGGGISALPDFVNFENPTYATTSSAKGKVTFVFEEELDYVNENANPVSGTPTNTAKFVAIMGSGMVVYATANGTGDTDLKVPKLVEGNKKKVEVPFGSGLTEAPRYFGVLTGAVRSFATQKENFADTIRLATPVIYAPGRTKAPDLLSVKLSDKDGECENGLETSHAEFKITFTFDANIKMPQENGADNQAFHVWYLPGSGIDVDADKPRVRRVTTVSTMPQKNTTATEAFDANSKDARYISQKNGGVSSGTTGCMQDFESTAPSGTSPDAWSWKNAKYLAVELEKVTEDFTTPTREFWNYPAGMAIPN